MPFTLQLKFDANQEHQLQAVDSVVRLFEGMPDYEEAFQLRDEVVANVPLYEARSHPQSEMHHDFGAPSVRWRLVAQPTGACAL